MGINCHRLCEASEQLAVGPRRTGSHDCLAYPIGFLPMSYCQH
jgi:hypothetical protein